MLSSIPDSRGGQVHASLVPHPDAPARSVTAVGVMFERTREGLKLRYAVEAPTDRLVLPPPAKPRRTDGLWQTTCLELFVRREGDAYWEFNFSPSTQWAAYSLTSYREGMEPLTLDTPPAVLPMGEDRAFQLRAFVPLPRELSATIGLSAIVEETDGTKSYWALAHPPGKPDFHDSTCFALELSTIG